MDGDIDIPDPEEMGEVPEVKHVHSTPHKTALLKSIDIPTGVFCMPALSDSSSVLSPASSSENNNEHLNLSTDVEFTDSETELRHGIVCNHGSSSQCSHSNSSQCSYGSSIQCNHGSTVQTTITALSKPIKLPAISPQRILPHMSPLQGGISPTRAVLPEGFRDNISALLPTSTVRVKVRSRHASFSTPPKSPADTQWRLFKVNRDMKEESFDDINGERNFTQTLTLQNQYDSKLNVSDKEEADSSCPSSPRAAITACSPRHITRADRPGRTPSPSPPFTAPPSIPVRCVSPRPNTFTLKRKIVEDCSSPPKRPCNMALGHRSPTVEYRARTNSPAPLSPLAVSSHSIPLGEAVRSVPIHLLDRALPEQVYSDSSSDDSPPRNLRQPG